MKFDVNYVNFVISNLYSSTIDASTTNLTRKWRQIFYRQLCQLLTLANPGCNRFGRRLWWTKASVPVSYKELDC